MVAVITIFHVLAAVAIVGLVLLQHGKGADAGAAFGAGSAGSIFGARGPSSFLTRATGILATVFFLTSLSLAYLSGQTVERRSITDSVVPIEWDGPPAGARAGTPADVPSAGTQSDIPLGSTGDAPTMSASRPAADENVSSEDAPKPRTN